MIKITLSDPLVATEAGEWCTTQFGNAWKLWGKNLFSSKPIYEFEFEDIQNATIFSLRWAEHS